MAQVKSDRTTRSSLERDVAIAMSNWEDVSWVAAEWTRWSEETQLDYFIDWPVVEERTQRLLAMESTLPEDDERTAKLRLLRALVERNRPLVERMMSGPMKSWD
jgi:hypothetical protein